MHYVPDWISESEEQAILDRVYAIPDDDDSVWVALKRRRLQMWGGEVKSPFEAQSLPKWLLQIVQALVDAKVFSEEHQPNHALINGEMVALMILNQCVLAAMSSSLTDCVIACFVEFRVRRW